MPGALRIETASRADLDLVVEWAAREGWNPGLDDADCFFAADPGGFLVGRLDGVPVGCISVVTYPGDFAFLGCYIVTPPHRGRGHGLSLWTAGMDRLAGRVVGLDGVVAQQDNYRRSGFVLSHRNIRFGGRVDAGPASAGRLTAVGPELVEAVVAYDRAFFAGEREGFLRCWLQPDRRVALALVEEGTVTGYGVLRACREGFKVGPLFADSADGADLLFRGLAAHAGAAQVFLDCPEPHAAALDLAARHGLTPVFETARMYRGPAPELPLDRTFGITTFELG